MTVFIAWSTWHNLDRDRNNAVKWLLREADALIHIMKNDVRAQMKKGQRIKPALEQIMKTMGTTENVAYIHCFNPRTGAVFPPPVHGNKILTSLTNKNVGLFGNGYKIININDNRPILELTRPLISLNENALRSEDIKNDQLPDAGSFQGQMEKNDGDIHVVMGLTMDLYKAAGRADFHHAVIMISILLALGAGAVFFVFIIKKYIEDLSRMQRLKEQVQKNEKFVAIGQLSAGVAHEIRNPLSSIRGFARFFVHHFEDHEENREYAMIMVKEIDRINGVITDLITFARPLALHQKMVDVKPLVGHVLRLIEGDFRSRGAVISMAIDEHMPPLFMDEDQMKQVLLNLLINALNVLDAGQKIIVGGAVKKDGSRGYLWVEDEGPGIPIGDHQCVFDPFFSGGNKGTGLGLAIANKIVENHGGILTLESPVPGKPKGCRFTMSLPMTNKGDVP
ncbi:two-component system sensor histidine kinase NtrB [Desulfocicer vacuolatum]|nr:ATP-binding protein [Desulfocicer vacuolatum]